MPANNPFSTFSTSPLAGAISLVAITPSDVSDTANVLRQIYVGNGGDVRVVDTAGNEVTHINVPQGCYIGPFAVARVKASGTTATNLIGYV
jgi:hypothetical protein